MPAAPGAGPQGLPFACTAAPLKQATPHQSADLMQRGCESAVGAPGIVAGVVPTPDRGIPQRFLKRCEARLVLLDRVFRALFRRKDEVFEARAFQTSHRGPLDGVVVIVASQTEVSAFV